MAANMLHNAAVAARTWVNDVVTWLSEAPQHAGEWPSDIIQYVRNMTPKQALAAAVVGLGAALLVKNQLEAWKIERALSSLPRPRGSLPFLGHALILASGEPWNKMERWIREAGGKVIVINFFSKPGIVLSQPDLLRQVFNSKQRNYIKDIEVSYRPFMDILGGGLVTSEGQRWKKQRHLLSKAFRVDILEDTAPVAKRAVDRLSSKLEKLRGSGKTIEMAEEFRQLTLEVIGELILSLSHEESARVFPDLYLPIVEEANRRIWAPWRAYIPTPGWFRYNQTVRELNRYVCDVIRKRWAQRQECIAEGKPSPYDDILERVLADIDPKTWSEATVLELQDEFKTFILAGHETSAAMMTWAIYELTQNKQCLQSAVNEASSVFSSTTGRAPGLQGDDQFTKLELPGREGLNRLVYNVNLLKETLRKYSLVPVITRQALHDDKLGDISIPADTRVFVNIKAVHHDPKLWPEPDKYKPERFEREDIDGYAFLPFINGPRNCLGQHLALLEARIVVSLLLLRFKFTPRGPECGIPDAFTVPVCPEHGMHMYID